MEPLTSDDPAEVASYRLHARLGAGGMGRVYLAFTPGGRPVALKMVRPELGDDRDFRIRFRQELDAARRVNGLYTAQVLDADPAATPPWLVTAYVPGPSLQEAVSRYGPMPVDTVLLLMAGVAEALQVIHAAGVVHRDLKPSNVLLAPDGPRVIDFGISRAAETTPLTRSGLRIGSPDYMAPEQVANRPVSAAADVFALGSLAAYAVQGRPPFGAGNLVAILYRVVHEPADLSGCPSPLRGIIEQCLAKDEAERPAPAEIISCCRARTAGRTRQIAQPWLPPAVAAVLADRAMPPSAGPATRPSPHDAGLASPGHGGLATIPSRRAAGYRRRPRSGAGPEAPKGACDAGPLRGDPAGCRGWGAAAHPEQLSGPLGARRCPGHGKSIGCGLAGRIVADRDLDRCGGSTDRGGHALDSGAELSGRRPSRHVPFSLHRVLRDSHRDQCHAHHGGGAGEADPEPAEAMRTGRPGEADPVRRHWHGHDLARLQ